MKKLSVTNNSKEWAPKYLFIVSAIFVATLLISNIAAQKLFSLWELVFSSGILVFPLSYIFGDILTEVYGFNRARSVIYVGMLCNLLLVLVIHISIALPPAPGWELQEHFEKALSMIPRIVAASIIAYVLGELVNSYVMSKMKLAFEGKSLWIRTITSTIAGQFVDTIVFVLIAFYGVYPSSILLIAVISSWAFKVIYEICATPVTYVAVNKLKKLEGIEHFDRTEKLRII